MPATCPAPLAAWLRQTALTLNQQCFGKREDLQIHTEILPALRVPTLPAPLISDRTPPRLKLVCYNAPRNCANWQNTGGFLQPRG